MKFPACLILPLAAAAALLAGHPNARGQSAPAFTTIHSFAGENRANPRAPLVQGDDGNFYGTAKFGGSNGDGSVFRITAAGVVAVLHSFAEQVDGANPVAGLIQGSDGNFYGTTSAGGSNFGTVFKVTPAGDVTTLHNFTYSGTDGAYPYSGLVQGSDGNFYGTTYSGSSGYGTVFKVTPSGAFATLHSFSNSATDGGYPLAGLIQGSDGSFYGTTQHGGTRGAGTIFKITPAGAFTLLYSFSDLVGDPGGYEPAAGLIQDSAGNLYGTNSQGGSIYYPEEEYLEEFSGTVFQLSASGVYTVLHGFQNNGGDGTNPAAGLVRDSDGNLYGTTQYGGDSDNLGTVFRITSTGNFDLLHSFPNSRTQGNQPVAALIQGGDGNFYGTTQFGGAAGMGTVFKVTPAGVFTNLYSFIETGTDGAGPRAGLVAGRDGNFYGTTENGGTNDAGTVYQVTSAGAVTVLRSFTAIGTDGAFPYAGVIRGRDGNFYGTTINGGSKNSGTVFKITPAGVATTLHSFTKSGADGAFPRADLTQGSDGNFYGTTEQGGNATYAAGTVFRITPTGGFTTLHSFNYSATDGSYPRGGVVQGTDGNFYGTTQNGGQLYNGTVFRITPTGVTTILHSFLGYNYKEGVYPEASLILASTGDFYGTTRNGGGTGAGVVFRIAPDGTLHTAHSFTETGADGAYPEAGLLQAMDGNFYGTTQYGGTGDVGTVFKLTPTGTYSTIHSFTGVGTEGTYPLAGLVQAADGSFYGTTQFGGVRNEGTIFKVTVPSVPAITSALTATATTGAAFSYQTTATQAPTKYGASGLPGGLTINQTTGLISGVPTAAAGSFTVTIAAFNSLGAGTAKLALTVKLGPPVITSATTAMATVGKTFSYQITAIGNPTSYATSSIPPGLSFDASAGKFTGTPTKAGTYKPLLSATNSAGTGRVNLNLTVNVGAPVITSAATAAGQVGVAFSYQATATNSPTSYRISSLPAGLTFDTTTGKLTGTPTKAGSYRPLISATNESGTGSANVDLTIKPAKPVITSELNPPARQGVAFAYQIVATNGPTSYATSSVPPGLSFSTSTGKFSGTPTKAGTYKPLVSATNSGGSASVNLNIIVKPPA